MENISSPLGRRRLQGTTQTIPTQAGSDGPPEPKGPVLFTREAQKIETFPSTDAAPSATARTTQNALQQPAPLRKPGKGKLEDLLKLIKPNKHQGPPVPTKLPQQWQAWEGITTEQREAMETFVESPLYKAVKEAQDQHTDVGMLVTTSLTAYAGKVLRDGAWVKSPTNKLTLAGATAIRLYGQQAYPEVNPWFWLTKDGQRKTPPAYMETMRETIEAGLSARPDLEYDKNSGTFTVYRGTDFWPPNLKVGDNYADWGFQSTSSDPDVVKDRFDMKYRMEIVLTKETGAKSVEDLTANKREKEVLIPTGVCFRVEKYDPKTLAIQKADGTIAYENVVNIKLVAVVPDVVDIKPVPVGRDPAARPRGFGFTGTGPGARMAGNLT